MATTNIRATMPNGEPGRLHMDLRAGSSTMLQLYEYQTTKTRRGSGLVTRWGYCLDLPIYAEPLRRDSFRSRMAALRDASRVMLVNLASQLEAAPADHHSAEPAVQSPPAPAAVVDAERVWRKLETLSSQLSRVEQRGKETLRRLPPDLPGQMQIIERVVNSQENERVDKERVDKERVDKAAKQAPPRWDQYANDIIRVMGWTAARAYVELATGIRVPTDRKLDDALAHAYRDTSVSRKAAAALAKGVQYMTAEDFASEYNIVVEPEGGAGPDDKSARVDKDDPAQMGTVEMWMAILGRLVDRFYEHAPAAVDPSWPTRKVRPAIRAVLEMLLGRPIEQGTTNEQMAKVLADGFARALPMDGARLLAQALGVPLPMLETRYGIAVAGRPDTQHDEPQSSPNWGRLVRDVTAQRTSRPAKKIDMLTRIDPAVKDVFLPLLRSDTLSNGVTIWRNCHLPTALEETYPTGQVPVNVAYALMVALRTNNLTDFVDQYGLGLVGM